MKKWQKLAVGGSSAGLIALAIIQGWEGGNVHKAYYDRIGRVWTICNGHTSGVREGQIATDAQCEEYLREDEKNAAEIVSRCINVPLKQNERAAFISAAENIGPSVVCGSTLQRLANSGNITGACLQLTDAKDKDGNYIGWSFSNGKQVQGLHNRRVEERNLCLGYYQ